MMTIAEFAVTVELDAAMLQPAYEAFTEELRVPRKTRAARCADLADGLRRLGIPEDTVYAAVHTLVVESRR